MKKAKPLFLSFGFLWYEWILFILLPLTNTGLVDASFVLVCGCEFGFFTIALFVLLFLKRKGLVNGLPNWLLVVASITLSTSQFFIYFGQLWFGLSVYFTTVFMLFFSGSFAILFMRFSI
jgi:hypothetical protein